MVMPGTFSPEEAEASPESFPDASPEESTPEESAPSQFRGHLLLAVLVSLELPTKEDTFSSNCYYCSGTKATSIKQLRKPKQQTEGRYKEPFYDVSKQITQANIFAFLGE
ncbi:uncharacterized protein CXQ87_002477 [Candidozyma duobushaemuli]|uniref:Uncharacterized protein n=1 Tax=Candidozyma duobushaemuli TaxID=1231522 RepID=A0A2V1A7E2_9ASCO|nr:uncharacterized protein CXQ87_002477 [[Candida] duobushaemulonis]PVH14347.1 hypothetical protein CXQ87_002477 [[Candida] duobushaemulonis]